MRPSAAPGPNRLWLALPVLAVVVVGVAITVWIGENRRESTSVEDPLASLDAAVEAASEEDPAELSSTGSDVEADSPTPAPEPTPAAVPASTSPATRVTSITWDTVDGETEVVIRGDGLFKRGRVDASRLGSPPRVLIRLRDITTSFETRRFDVASSELTAIRVGHHPELRPPMLYVVLDLAGTSVISADGLTVEGDVARMRVRSR